MSKIQDLADVRRVAADAKARVKALRDEFEAAIAAEVEQANALAKEVAELEEQVKADALGAYAETGNKKPFDGVEVKTFKVMDYAPDAAFAWARESGLALSLDKKAFEKIAGATDLSFVKHIEEPRAQIKSDLSEFIVIRG